MSIRKRAPGIFCALVFCLILAALPAAVFADGPTPNISYAIFTNTSVIPVENKVIYPTTPMQNVDGIPLPVMWTNSGYNVTLHGSMDVDHWDWSVGGAPAGMTFDRESGTLSGRPSQAQSGYMVINAENENGKGRTFWLDYVVLDISMMPSISTNASLPDAYVGQSYHQYFELEGYLGASREWSLESGTLPAGMSVSAFATKGVLSGTPTETGTFRFTIAMENRAGKTTKEFTLRVRPGLENVDITTSTIPFGVLGEAYSTTLQASGTRPVTWSVDPRYTLPEGLTLNSETGVLSGTPTVAGYQPFAIVARNALGRANSSDSVYYGFQVYEQPVITMADAFHYVNGEAVFIPFSNTGSSGNWSISAGSLPDGTYLSGDGIYGTIHESGTFNVTLRLSVAAGVYDTHDITFEVVDTYGFSVSQTTSHTFPSLTEGYSDNVLLSKRITVTISNTGTAPTGDFSVYLSGTDASSFFVTNSSVASLASGASSSFKVNPNLGLTPGRYTATVNVKELTSQTVKSFDVSFAVVEAAVRPTVVTEDVGIVNGYVHGAMIGQPWSYQLYAEGTEPITWECYMGTLPSGLTLNATTGLISGIPTETFSGSLYFDAENVAGTSNNHIDFNFEVCEPLEIYVSQNEYPDQPGAVAYNDEELPPAFLHDGYINPKAVYLLANNRTQGNVEFSMLGDVPSFARVYGDNAQVFSGRVEEADLGTHHFIFRATLTDGAGNVLDTADRPMTLTVYPQMTSTATYAHSIEIPELTAGIPMPDYDVSGAVSGGKPPYTFSVANGEALPAGIQLSSSGVLSGTPTLGTPYSQVCLKATDASGNQVDVYVVFEIGLDGFSVDIPDGTEFIDSLTITVTPGASPDMYFTYVTTLVHNDGHPTSSDTRVPNDGRITIDSSCRVNIRGYQTGSSASTGVFRADYTKIARPDEPDIIASPNQDSFSRSLDISLSTLGDQELYYTIDGTDPAEGDVLGPNAMYYTEPFMITETTRIKAVAYDAGYGIFGDIAEETFTKVAPTLYSIYIATPPALTNYTYKDSFDPSGMVVNAIWKGPGNEGTVRTEAVDGYTFDPYHFEGFPKDTVYINYNGKTASFLVDIARRNMNDTEVVFDPALQPVYKGSEQEVLISAINAGAGQLQSITDYTFGNGTNLATNVGENTVVINGVNKCTGTTSATWSLRKADPTALFFDLPGLAELNRAYTGAPVSVAAPTLKAQYSGAGTVTVKYDGSAEAPTALGSYAVTFDVAGGQNFNSAEDIPLGTLRIGKPADPAVISGTASVVLNSTVDLSANVGGAVGDVSYAIVGESLGCMVDENTGVFTAAGLPGDITVRVTVAESTNYAGKTADIVVTVCGALDVTIGHACELQNNLTLRFKFGGYDWTQYENIRLDIERQRFADASDAYDWTNETLTDYITEGDGRISFAYQGIAAAEMGDLIRVTLYAEKDGVAYRSQQDEYSIKTYAYYVLEHYLENENSLYKKLCTLLVDMLHYGAEAQTYFGRHTSNLVDADLTDAMLAKGTAIAPSYQDRSSEDAIVGATAQIVSKALNLGSSIILNTNITFNTTPSDSVKIVYWYTPLAGGEQRVTVPFSEFYYDSVRDRYRASLSTVAAADFGTTIHMAVYDGEAQISNTYSYSIDSYVNAVMNMDGYEPLKSLMSAMMKYSNSALNYFR